MVRISACHVEGPGSIPGRGGKFLWNFFFNTMLYNVHPWGQGCVGGSSRRLARPGWGRRRQCCVSSPAAWAPGGWGHLDLRRTYTEGVLTSDTDIDENVDLAARYSSTGKASTVKLAWAMKFLKMPSSFHLSPSLNTLFKMYDGAAINVDT